MYVWMAQVGHNNTVMISFGRDLQPTNGIFIKNTRFCSFLYTHIKFDVSFKLLGMDAFSCLDMLVAQASFIYGQLTSQWLIFVSAMCLCSICWAQVQALLTIWWCLPVIDDFIFCTGDLSLAHKYHPQGHPLHLVCFTCISINTIICENVCKITCTVCAGQCIMVVYCKAFIIEL